MNPKIIATLMLSVCMVTACGQPAKEEVHIRKPPTPAPKLAENEVLVKLYPSRVTRRGVFRMTFNVTQLSENIRKPKRDELVEGKLDVGKEKVSIFLPKYGPYSTTSKQNHSFKNTSTRVSVDSDNNGVIERSENWWSSLPVRLGDQMFVVKAIDPGGTWIVLAKSSSPLAGLVVGKPCPPFKFTTTDGKSVSLADYKGKYLLLDVWSFT
jgi:hypothetical protein